MPKTPSVIAATGLPYTDDRFLTPEREAVVLTCLSRHPNGTSTGQVAAALEFNIVNASRLLQEMADRGLVRRDQSGQRVLWEPVVIEVAPQLVVENHKPRIREYLIGRRDMAGAIAQALGLPRDEVTETCKAMMLAGDLVGTPIGATYVYALDIRGTQRIDERRATEIPMSPGARFQAELAKLAPEKPIALRRQVREAGHETHRAREARLAQARQEERLRLDAELALSGERWLSDVAKEAGVTPKTVRGWLRGHPELVAGCRELQGRIVMSAEVASKYLAVRLNRSPEVKEARVAQARTARQESRQRRSERRAETAAVRPPRARLARVLTPEEQERAQERAARQAQKEIRRQEFVAAQEARAAARQDRANAMAEGRRVKDEARAAEREAQKVAQAAERQAQEAQLLLQLEAQGELLTVDAAKELGVTTVTLLNWLHRHPAEYAQCRKVDPKRLAVPRAVLGAYRAALAAPKPLTPKQQARAQEKAEKAARRQEVLARREEIASAKRVRAEALAAERASKKAAHEACLEELSARGERLAPEVAAQFGVKLRTLLAWIGRRPRMQGQCRQVDGQWALPAAVVQTYDAWTRGFWPIEEAAPHAGLETGVVRGLVNRDRVPHEGTGQDALVDVTALKAYKDRQQQVERSPEQQAEARAMARQVVPDGYQTVSNAARGLGIEPAALHKWLGHHSEARELCSKEEKYLLVPPQVISMYLQAIQIKGAELVTTRPENSLLIWDAVALVGWSYTKLYKMLAEGQLKAAQVGGRVYFDLASLLALKEKLDAETVVPAGWITLRGLAEALGLDRSSVKSWFDRNGFELRKLRDPQRQLVVYISPEAAAAYRAHREACPGGVKVTPQVEAELRALVAFMRRRQQPAVIPQVAERYGVSTTTVKNLLNAAPSKASRACTVDPLILLPRVPLMLPAPLQEAAYVEADVVVRDVPRVLVPVTLELEERMRAELPAGPRPRGETKRLAEKYGLTIGQVRNALSRIPIRKDVA